jgi:hypothetical protein
MAMPLRFICLFYLKPIPQLQIPKNKTGLAKLVKY